MAKKKLKYPEYNLGERLKYLRQSRKLTQKDLAQAAKLSQATIANIETGAKDPSVETLSQIASVLDVHIATLFSAEEIYVFDLKRLRRKYSTAAKLTPHLYMAIGQVIQFAKDIEYMK